MAEFDGDADQRRYQRTLVETGAELLFDGTTGSCKVLDISPGGAKVESAAELDAQAPVSLKFGGDREFQAIVAWRQGSYYGLEFLGDPEEIADLLMALAS